MNIPIPADLEYRLQPHLSTLSQCALEAIAIAAYTHRLISTAEVQRLLNLSSHLATDAFLKQHGAMRSPTLEDIQQDIQSLDQALYDHSL